MDEENETSKIIRVVVVDDHLVVREGLRLILDKAGKGKGIALVGVTIFFRGKHTLRTLAPERVSSGLR